MEPIRLNTQEAILYIALINAGIGFVLGLIPLIFGIVKGKTRYGIFGLLAATAGGAILGLFLSIPAVAIFIWLIVRGQKSAATAAEESNNQ